MNRRLICQILGGLCVVVLPLGGCQSTQPVVQYPDPDVPGLTPKVFAGKSISLPGRFEQNITMSGNGKDYYYGTADASAWRYEAILHTRLLPGGKTATDTVPFVRNFRFEREKFIGEPFLSPDGRKLFFVADLPPDIWVSEQGEDGGWHAAVKLDAPVNSYAGEWNPTLSARGTMYFASTRTDSGKVAPDGKIYRATLANGKYVTAEPLPGLINREDAGDPCIAPDESYLVFSSWRKGGYGGTDLYLSRRGANGDWSQPLNLGPTINTPHEEVGPRISADGKYLFFHRRDKWQNATSSDIYWVDIAVLKNVKE
jgi:hypothetical protein